jgi:cyclopropane fatty-acyl-phospholipid synthase-like methyltransferase
MAYFDSEENVQEYIEMAEGYDGRELIDVLIKYVSEGATVLELGMGPGKDLDILNESFRATGSDRSASFLKRYRATHPDADLVLLDAAAMDIDRTFDAIYSNKVLQHLTREELEISLRRQASLLNGKGILFHTFWYGDREEEHAGLRFLYYTESTFAQVVGPEYELVETVRYAEMEENDSIYFVLRKTR